MSELDLDAIEGRANAATQGPWAHDTESDSYMGCGEVFTWGEGVEGGNIAAPSGDLYPRSGYSPQADMWFIAHARADVPALIARIRELEAVVERVGRFLDGTHGLNENNVKRGLLKVMAGIDTDFPTEVHLSVYASRGHDCDACNAYRHTHDHAYWAEDENGTDRCLGCGATE